MTAATRMLQSAGAIGKTVLDLFYPPQCAGCGSYCGLSWCSPCHARTRRYSQAQLERELITEAGNALSAFSACPHEDPVRKAIHAFKYEGVPALAPAFAQLMVDAAKQACAGAEAYVLMPVPLHTARLRERGYNQSEVLANAIARVVPGTRVDAHTLARVRATEQQAHLDRDARKQNMLGAFTARTIAAGARVLLVDDVLTTGSTLAACADALFAAGATRVAAITLARADL